MVVVTATPHVRAPWSFGRPQGLRALAALALCLSLTVFALPAVRPMLVPNGTPAPVFGPLAQVLLGLLAAGAGLLLILEAKRLERTDAARGHASAARVIWALVTLASGLAVLMLLPLRTTLVAGRLAGDMAGWAIVLLDAFVGLTIIVFGIDALRPRRAYRHAGSAPRANASEAPSMAAWARGPQRPRRESPQLSPVQVIAWGSSTGAHPRGFSYQTGPSPLLPATAGVLSSPGGTGPSRRAIYASELALPYRVFIALLALMPVLFLLLKLLIPDFYF